MILNVLRMKRMKCIHKRKFIMLTYSMAPRQFGHCLRKIKSVDSPDSSSEVACDSKKSGPRKLPAFCFKRRGLTNEISNLKMPLSLLSRKYLSTMLQ